MNAPNHHQYNIGAVARLTQIHPETIRVWERRYELVVPKRSDSGRRIYSDDDIERLLLVKQLTELGNAVSGVAKLSNQELRGRLTATESRELKHQARPGSPCRVLFMDEPLKIRLGRDLSRYTDIEVLDTLPKDNKSMPDALIIGVATLNKKTQATLQAEAQKAGCKAVIAVYSFGQPSVVKELDKAGIICLKNPIGAADIREICKLLATGSRSLQSESSNTVAPRRFSEAQLAKVATMKGSIACECPNHLAELIINLCAFEQYSNDCEDSNPRDAAVHAQLNHATARARTILEESLARLIEIERIKV